ncbi:MAG: ankyrin repeat domain-containing protein [Gemmatimonadetes bacterium]|nr:ankyrin repeat domain-containing protein [Gemmatimonadota bacterium]
MPVRRLPVRPNLDQLKHQAKDLLRGIHVGDPAAIAELREHHPDPIVPASAKLADAQLVLARSYQTTSWTRLVQAAQLATAIWRDDLNAVRDLVTGNPNLIREQVLIRTDSNWGPPMTYAANLGRDRIIQLLHRLGATDLESAAGRAALQGKVNTARMLYEMAGRPALPDGALGGPAYTLSAEGTALLLMLGARVRDEAGNRLAPVDVVLQTDGRNPGAKHAILEMYVRHGLELPDTPTMALHRGRIDLLEEHLRRDPGLLSRTFSHREIYPAEMGCGDPLDATVGTPLGGSTLLHMCVDYDELEIARWLLEQGMDVSVRAAVGRDGFGGHTALFNTVVSQPNFWMNYRKRGPFVAPFTELLLERGAAPNVRASIWKRLHPGHGDTTRHDYRDVTAMSWGRRFHDPIFVSEPAMRMIDDAGGVE